MSYESKSTSRTVPHDYFANSTRHPQVSPQRPQCPPLTFIFRLIPILWFAVPALSTSIQESSVCVTPRSYLLCPLFVGHATESLIEEISSTRNCRIVH